jgi:hypothetical protein
VILQCFLSKHKILVSLQVINIDRYLHNIRNQLSYLFFTHVYVAKCIVLDEAMVLVWKFHNLPKIFLNLKCLCLVKTIHLNWSVSFHFQISMTFMFAMRFDVHSNIHTNQNNHTHI